MKSALVAVGALALSLLTLPGIVQPADARPGYSGGSHVHIGMGPHLGSGPRLGIGPRIGYGPTSHSSTTITVVSLAAFSLWARRCTRMATRTTTTIMATIAAGSAGGQSRRVAGIGGAVTASA
jgi:hypothetical protein